MIDKKSMGLYAAKLYTTLATIVTTLLAFEADPPAASTRDNECALSSVQVQATVALFRNSSCVYDMTVESILGAM